MFEKGSIPSKSAHVSYCLVKRCFVVVCFGGGGGGGGGGGKLSVCCVNNCLAKNIYLTKTAIQMILICVLLSNAINNLKPKIKGKKRSF